MHNQYIKAKSYRYSTAVDTTLEKSIPTLQLGEVRLTKSRISCTFRYTAYYVLLKLRFIFSTLYIRSCYLLNS